MGEFFVCLFFVIPFISPELVLGYPWLLKHNPSINWPEGRVKKWIEFCLQSCLRTDVSHSAKQPKTPEPVDLSRIPPEYHSLAPVFSKQRALSLPPHCPFDCPVDLLPDAPLPSSRLYKLSGPEKEAMREYIEDSLGSGIICPSTSPVGAGFFVGKKDGTLRPCIDHRGLNQITIKNKYSLRLINSVHEQLHSAKIFTELDLGNAYHLVRICKGNKWKLAFNVPWTF